MCFFDSGFKCYHSLAPGRCSKASDKFRNEKTLQICTEIVFKGWWNYLRGRMQLNSCFASQTDLVPTIDDKKLPFWKKLPFLKKLSPPKTIFKGSEHYLHRKHTRKCILNCFSERLLKKSSKVRCMLVYGNPGICVQKRFN